MVLKHAIGRSTIGEGFAIPRDFEEWINAPARGSKREIWLVFGEIKVPVCLRRIDNAQAKVQIKYENKAGEPLRNWLATVFAHTLATPCGEYFELRKIGDDIYQVEPHPFGITKVPMLNIKSWIFHNGAKNFLNTNESLSEIPVVINSVPFISEEGQAYYNRKLSDGFKSWKWEAEHQVISDLGLKCDFAKEGVCTEVEFGNARTYYQDYLKFILANRHTNAELGVLIVPTERFAKHLCEVGRMKAMQKCHAKYSGMIHFNKVKRELQYLEFMLSMPIAIAGIESKAL